MHSNNIESQLSNSSDTVSINQRELQISQPDDDQVAKVTILYANSLPTITAAHDSNETTVSTTVNTNVGKPLLRNNSYSTIRSYDTVVKSSDYRYICSISTANSSNDDNFGDGKKSIKAAVSEGSRAQYVLGGKANLNTIIIWSVYKTAILTLL